MRQTTFALAAALAACSEPIPLAWKLDLGAASVSTPLVTESYIAVGTEAGLVIVDRDGKKRCDFDAHGEVISAPKTDGKRIFFGSTNYIVYAVEPSCVEAWKFATRDRIKSDPLVAGGRVYTSSYDGHIYALSADSGERLWTFPESARPPPAAEPEEKRPKKGAPPPAPEPPLVVGDFSYSSPVLDNGVIYLGNLDGYLYAVRAEDGVLMWRLKTDAPVTSTPLIERGVAYFGSNDGHVYAVSLAAPPAVTWKVATRDWVNSSAAVAAGVLFIGSNDRHIYAIDTVSGQSAWSFATTGPAIARPAIYKNLVLAAGASGDGAVYALQAVNGALFWKFQTEGKVESDPVVDGDQLYVTSADQKLYAFKFLKTTEE
jgi:outer membrane protein assembly factor BamB